MVAASLTETLKDSISLAKATRLFASPPHIATLHRWTTQGVRGVRLQTWIVGGKRVTTPAAVERFLTALNATDEPSEPVEPGGVDTGRASLAGAKLAALGVR